jgi:hypothetical protein
MTREAEVRGTALLAVSADVRRRRDTAARRARDTGLRGDTRATYSVRVEAYDEVLDLLEAAGENLLAEAAGSGPSLAEMKDELVRFAGRMSGTEFSVKRSRYLRAGGWWPVSLDDWATAEGRALSAEIRNPGAVS